MSELILNPPGTRFLADGKEVRRVAARPYNESKEPITMSCVHFTVRDADGYYLPVDVLADCVRDAVVIGNGYTTADGTTRVDPHLVTFERTAAK